MIESYVDTYMGLLQTACVEPNFWCSSEYIKKAGLKIVVVMPLNIPIYVSDEDWAVFPTSFYDEGNTPFELPLGCKGIWSDWVGFNPKGLKPEFLDYEYIYDPKAFLNLSGNKWMTFRKNCRKFPNRYKGRIEYTSLFYVDEEIDDVINKELECLLINWLEDRNDEIQDDDVILKYLYEGENRKVLWDADSGKVLGINIWDSNYQYINYRYCFTRKMDYLSEYMRYLFYTDPIILNEGKLVNDGGVLGNENLKKFKDKLNPIRVRRVNSWKRRS